MKKLLNEEKIQLIENIKILLYKENNDIFSTLDFENDLIYQEPLLFAFFKNRSDHKLEDIIYGHISPEKRPKDVFKYSDENGRIYIPNIGWLICNKRNSNLNLYELINKAELGKDETRLEPSLFIEGTNIEILKYPINLLKQFYYDENLNRIEVDIENITKLHINHITKAFKLIKKYVPDHFTLIESVTKKIVIFNVDTNLRNSFATLSAQGIAFFNAYQKEYNEIFFIDDIAHQTGHLIFNVLIYDIEQFLKIKPTTIIQEIKNDRGLTIETRDIHVLFHAFYTYYTTFICLDAILDSQEFSGDKIHELQGRMKFYIGKCYLDLMLIDDPIESNNNAENLFTQKGLNLFLTMKNKYFEMLNKWLPIVKDHKLDNQLYNFSYSSFKELNPVPNEN